MTLPFREWSRTANVELTPGQRDALAAVLKVRIRPTAGAAGRYDVTPRNTVGALVIDGTTVLVEPKIEISRVLFLLGYCTDPHAWHEGEGLLDQAPDLVSGVTALFTILTRRALARGLLSGYRQVGTDLNTVRGRIDLAEQLRRRPGLDVPLSVTYVEHDEDILENRLLLAAALSLRGLPVRDAVSRNRLRQLIETLADVTPTTYHPHEVPEVTWTRLNLHYRPAVELARLLLQHQSPEVGTGVIRTPTLAIDMAVLFETFVRTALREALGATPQQFPAGDSLGLFLDERRQVQLKPDLTYWPRAKQCAFVGDVKYKVDRGRGHREDIYQLLAYATAARVREATLIYAAGPPAGPRDYRIPGADVDLHIRHLDLDQPPVTILQQIRRLAAKIVGPETPVGEGHSPERSLWPR